MGSFFLIWTIVWGLLYACLIPGKGIFDKVRPVVGVGVRRGRRRSQAGFF